MRWNHGKWEHISCWLGCVTSMFTLCNWDHFLWERLWSRTLIMKILIHPSDFATVAYCQSDNWCPTHDTFGQIKNIPWFLQIIIWPKRTSWSKGGPREERFEGLPLFKFCTTSFLGGSHTLKSKKEPLLFSWVTPPPLSGHLTGRG